MDSPGKISIKVATVGLRKKKEKTKVHKAKLKLKFKDERRWDWTQDLRKQSKESTNWATVTRYSFQRMHVNVKEIFLNFTLTQICFCNSSAYVPLSPNRKTSVHVWFQFDVTKVDVVIHILWNGGETYMFSWILVVL